LELNWAMLVRKALSMPERRFSERAADADFGVATININYSYSFDYVYGQVFVRGPVFVRVQVVALVC